MKTNLPLALSLFFFVFFACSPTNKKTQGTNDPKTGLKSDIYTNIQKIAEALPLTQQEALDFFNNLDSVRVRTFRNNQSQQFQYEGYTVFYEQPVKGRKLKGIGIDLDSTSHVNMEQLGNRLDAKWHSADLIEIKAGKIHYTADYMDSKKVRKKIHTTIGLTYNEDETENEITFISIDMEPEQKN